MLRLFLCLVYVSCLLFAVNLLLLLPVGRSSAILFVGSNLLTLVFLYCTLLCKLVWCSNKFWSSSSDLRSVLRLQCSFVVVFVRYIGYPFIALSETPLKESSFKKNCVVTAVYSLAIVKSIASRIEFDPGVWLRSVCYMAYWSLVGRSSRTLVLSVYVCVRMRAFSESF